MKTLVSKLALTAALGIFTFAFSAFSIDNEKITICHKDKVEIIVSANALQAHLDHGDKHGQCQNKGYVSIWQDDHYGAKNSISSFLDSLIKKLLK